MTDEFLVVYQRNQTITLHSIVGLRLDSDAKPIGNEFEIVPGAEDNQNHYPHIIFNPETNGYTLVWQSTLNGLVAALLDESGKLDGPIVILERPEFGGPEEYHVGRIIQDLAVIPSGNKLLILFRHRFSATKGNYWLATLDPRLENISAADFAKINKKPVNEFLDPNATNPKKKWTADLAVMQDGSALVFFADNRGVKRRKIDTDGKLSGKASKAFSGALNKKKDLFDPQVAFSTTSSGTVGLLIANQKESGLLANPATDWAQALDSKGRPIGDPVEVLKTDFFYYDQFGSLLIALPTKPTDTLFQFVWLQTLAFAPEGNLEEGSIVSLKLQVEP